MVHLLLLVRGSARARLRPDRGYPPQTRLRSGRIISRPADPIPQSQHRMAVAEEAARLPDLNGRDPLGRDPRERLAWPQARKSGGLSAADFSGTGTGSEF